MVGNTSIKKNSETIIPIGCSILLAHKQRPDEEKDKEELHNKKRPREMLPLVPHVIEFGSILSATRIVIEVADEHYQHCTVRCTCSKEFVAFSFGQEAHSSRKQQCEHHQEADGVKGGVAVSYRGQLVHGDDWKYK